MFCSTAFAYTDCPALQSCQIVRNTKYNLLLESNILKEFISGKKLGGGGGYGPEERLKIVKNLAGLEGLATLRGVPALNMSSK